MFELEVPEIYEGIVQIKSIAREASERTKIAVYSNDEKVDCVGACVGMRGSRVKDIVRELRGERVDIIRWNESPKEFIAGALSPAKISSIEQIRLCHSCRRSAFFSYWQTRSKCSAGLQTDRLEYRY
jgi:N utilization substance protein A